MYPLHICVKPFRSRGTRYTPGTIIVDPGAILSFRSRVTEGDVFTITHWDADVARRLQTIDMVRQTNLAHTAHAELKRRKAASQPKAPAKPVEPKTEEVNFTPKED